MSKRIKSRKRKHMGNRTFGGGNTKNRRGKGNRGGVGRAGFHKHQWLRTITQEGTNKRAKGIHGFHNQNERYHEAITLDQLSAMLAKGKFEKKGDAYVVDLHCAKVLSNGNISHKAIITAFAFSAKAAEKIKAAGGEAKVRE